MFGPTKSAASDRRVSIGPTVVAAIKRHLKDFGPGLDRQESGYRERLGDGSDRIRPVKRRPASHAGPAHG